jgi:type I restriction enzyme S subunit
MNRELLDAINIQAKREGFFWPVLRAIIFEQLAQRFPAKSLLSILSDHRGGSWGADQQAGLLPAPSLRSPDIRHGKIDYSQAETRYYTPKELEKHRLQSGDILVIKSNGSLDLVGKSQLFVSTDAERPVTASNFVLVVSPDRKQVNPTYLDWFLKSPQALVWRVDKQRTTTGLRNLDSAGYLATSVPVPPNLEIQIEITEILAAVEDGEWPENPYFDIALAERAKKVADTFQHLASESEHQQSLLAKLKQAILQEAIEGKLTSDWRASHPEVEPASELLERIQAEKASLIAAKKLRPEKPLPKIPPAEIPFEIPTGWEWCRFLDVQIGSDAGSSPKCEERPVVGREWGILKVSATSGASFRQEENKFFRSNAPNDLSSALQEGDLILSRANTKELAGNSVLVDRLTLNLLLSDKTIRFRLSQEVSSRYANIVNKASFVRAHFIRHATGASPSMKNLSRDSITSHLFPLPPLAEQVAIVERVESLMATCRALEAEIEQTRTHAAHLLQAVLKEAFAPAST